MISSESDRVYRCPARESAADRIRDCGTPWDLALFTAQDQLTASIQQRSTLWDTASCSLSGSQYFPYFWDVLNKIGIILDSTLLVYWMSICSAFVVINYYKRTLPPRQCSTKIHFGSSKLLPSSSVMPT